MPSSNNTQEKALSLKIEKLSLTRNEKLLFRDFSHVFDASLIHAILGPSGCGKTSLLHAIAGLLPIDGGKISKITALSYLFQEPRLLPWLSLEKNLSLVIEKLYTDKNLAKEKVASMLEKVHLIDYAKRFPSEISGGERQRLALARAFLFPSPLLLMDEAFQSQDIVLKLQLMDLLQSLHEEDRRTIILVSHDIREALSLADTIMVLKGSPIKKELLHSMTQEKSQKQSASKTYVNFPQDLQERENDILRVFSHID
ncbi:MAG: ABC transporter ATP-binding protein [Spirochaetota bacterium]|jgi:ABC-type nitrate/sulfonate/bicarbonate transport system ATPase subunit|nr:ABC transporter ATP-binding protein [Spirochaetota bacterium]NMA55912.1 ABC transporter ATP-binding protein [Treponema sp.]